MRWTLGPFRRFATYVQGQTPEPKLREYFYYIDHQGMLFLDDARMKNFTSCFKDKRFLRFFFERLRANTTDRYPEFPYVSLCGRERNYARCDDYPIVFTHLLSGARLAYNHAGDLLQLEFMPEKIFMSPETGRVYHPAPERVGSVGLIRSKLAVEMSQFFSFEDGEGKPPTHFAHNGLTYKLDNEWYYEAVRICDKLVKIV